VAVIWKVEVPAGVVPDVVILKDVDCVVPVLVSDAVPNTAEAPAGSTPLVPSVTVHELAFPLNGTLTVP